MDGSRSFSLMQGIYNRIRPQDVRIADIGEDGGVSRGKITDLHRAPLFADWLTTCAVGGITEFKIFLGDIARLDAGENRVVTTPGQVKSIVECLLDADNEDSAKVTAVYLSDIRDLSHESMCLLFYLKSQKPAVAIGIDLTIADNLRDSGVTMWETFANFRSENLQIDDFMLSTEEEYNTQVAEYRAGIIRAHRAGSGGCGGSKDPIHPIMIAGLSLAAVGTAMALAGLSTALAGVDFASCGDFAFHVLGDNVMAYQVMMLGGSILALTGLSMILCFQRYENKTHILRQYGGNHNGVWYAEVGKNFMVYAPAIALAMSGGIGLLAGYAMTMKDSFGVTEMMAASGSGLLFMTCVGAGAVIVLNKVSKEPIEWPWVAQIATTGLATTAVASMLPWAMANTTMFADPMVASVTVFSAMAVVPLLGFLAKYAVMGGQQLASVDCQARA